MQGNGAGLPTDLDAIIVLGGGQDPQAQHRLPPWVKRRLDTAADLQALQEDRTCRVLLSGGGEVQLVQHLAVQSAPAWVVCLSGLKTAL